MSLSIRPKKHLGQHFLKDKNIARKIVDSLDIYDNMDVLELGPGTGILTGILIEKFSSNLKVVEIDNESVEFLQNNFPEISGHLIHQDFLKLPLKEYFPKPFVLIGNFPYNISSQIFFKVLENRDFIPQVVCMIQKEVAERIASPPGSKRYGILSVLLQAFYNIEYLFTVNEQVFSPPPKVKSAVIKLTRNTMEKLPCDEKLFFSIVKSGFNQRRKTLRNSLKGFFQSPSANLDILSKRPEELNVEDFIWITGYVSRNR